MKVSEGPLASGQSALRTVVFINGGAAVSILPFVGGLVGQGKLTLVQVGVLAKVLMYFAYGVAFGAVGLIAAFLSNFFQVGWPASRQKVWETPYFVATPAARVQRSIGMIAMVIGLLSLAGSLGSFLVGMRGIGKAIRMLTG